jgi:uncharacterized protein
VQVVDANVLLYAVNTDAAHHDRARRWLDDALGGAEAVGFSWVALLAFLRLSTRPGLFPQPLSIEEASAVIEHWLAQPAARVLQPPAAHLATLSGLLQRTGTGANLVNDAHLAALAVDHGAGIVSFNRDFARFPGVRWAEPREPV